MEEDDVLALEELASELSRPEAINFLRTESSLGLKDCFHWCENIAKKLPESFLAKWIEKYKKALAEAK